MTPASTTELFNIQPICNSVAANYFVAGVIMDFPSDPGRAGRWTKEQREDRGISAAELAARINGQARLTGDPTVVSQQVVSKFEQGNTKRLPPWARFIVPALVGNDDEMKEAPHLSMAQTDDAVSIRKLPVLAGLGPGGFDDETEYDVVTFSRDLIERELKAPADSLLAIEAEGNSMWPEYHGGDQILVDTRRISIANPGAFCLWDGDGYVIKFLEKIPDSDPPKVRVISKNQELYPPRERLVEEINLIGRVVWFGRRVQ